MKDVQRKFSVRYFLNLVLVDEEERRYFKQQVNDTGEKSFARSNRNSVFSQEIILWRKQDKDKDKAKDSAKQYSHYEAPTSSMKSEESVNGIAAGETSPAHGPVSSENNSDSPSD